MARNVVAFIGKNENGILRETSLKLMSGLEAFGLSGHVIDLCASNWPDHFNKLLSEGLFVGWGAVGFGSDIRTSDGPLWDRVPFVSALADPPCWFPQVHRPVSRGVVLGYFYEEWLDVQRRFIRASNLCGRLPVCVPPNPHRDRIPWSARSHRMVFIKTGESPMVRRASWAKWPQPFRTVLEEAANEACRHGTMGLTDLLINCIAAHGLCTEGRLDVLFALMLQLDLYVRAERSTRMVQALSRLPAEIIGRGWDHIDQTQATATFRPAIDAAHLPALLADTQFVVNTTPNFGSGVHERVLGAFAARACAVSDHNDYSRTALADIPSFFGVEWHTDDLSDRLAEIWAIGTDLGPATDAALQRVETFHTPIIFMQAILELAELGMFAINFANPPDT